MECIKSRKPCNADIEIGQRATTLCLLVNVARQVGQVGNRCAGTRPPSDFPIPTRRTSCFRASVAKAFELPEV